MKIIFRILLLPFGIFKKLFEFANVGGRDIHNILMFSNCIIEKNCCINKNTHLNEGVHLFENCIINNSEIGSYTYLAKNCLVQNAKIGKFCSIATDVLIGVGQHPTHLFSTSPLFYKRNNPLNFKLIKNDIRFDEYRPIDIGNDVWIGARSIIMDGVKIGHGAIVAANSVVTKDVPEYAIVAGIPAKVIKFRFDNEKSSQILSSGWWNNDLKNIVDNFTYFKK